MASVITHIVLALKILPLLLTHLPESTNVDAFKKEFILGTSFPDNRNALGLKREDTHIESVSWQMVIDAAKDSPFKAGMLFHNLLDILRIRNIELTTCPIPSKARATTIAEATICSILKFIEDAYLYPALGAEEWAKITSYFENISPSELEPCPNKREALEQIHKAIQNYLAQPPTMKTVDAFLVTLGLTPFSDENKRQAYDGSKAFDIVLNNKHYKHMFITFCDSLPTLLSSEPTAEHLTPWFTREEAVKAGYGEFPDNIPPYILMLLGTPFIRIMLGMSQLS